MSDSARQAKDLRDHATCLLNEAVRCGDPARRDSLLREAVARLDEARLLLGQTDHEKGPGPSHSARRNH